MTAELIREFTDEAVSAVGLELADAFDNLSQFAPEVNMRLLDDEGMEAMAAIFEGVPANKRADVYIAFIQELDLRCIPFNRRQFTGPDS
jgi:hypothetical protein